MKPLRGGLRLEEKKEASLLPWSITRPSLPRRVRIPFQGQSLVQTGQRVRVGEKIAETSHASLSGTVSRIGRFPHPVLVDSEAIEILSDGKDERLPGIGIERNAWKNLSREEIRKILLESGIDIVGADLVSARDPQVDTLIINACESEPYLTSDHSLLMSHPVEILKGGEILKQALGARDLIVALEDNKEEVAELLKSKTFFHSWSGAKIEVLPARYPLGDERILVRELLGRNISGVFVSTVAEVFAAYEAVVFRKPFYERVVTIGGECVVQPHNFWIRVGTLAEEAVKYAKGFLRDPEKVVLGGPMTGTALESLDVPILKNVPGILGLPRELAKPESVEPCIRCGECVESCPVFLSPALITLAAEKDEFELARGYGASLCIECGNCSYVCPAKRPMLELIQYAQSA